MKHPKEQNIQDDDSTKTLRNKLKIFRIRSRVPGEMDQLLGEPHSTSLLEYLLPLIPQLPLLFISELLCELFRKKPNIIMFSIFIIFTCV